MVKGGDENRLVGIAGLPFNINPDVDEYGDARPIAGAIRDLPELHVRAAMDPLPRLFAERELKLSRGFRIAAEEGRPVLHVQLRAGVSPGPGIEAALRHTVSVAAGVPAEVRIHDHSAVAAGDVLVRLDPASYKLALDKAEAEIDSERQQCNLSSAIRLFVLDFHRGQLADLKGYGGMHQLADLEEGHGGTHQLADLEQGHGGTHQIV